MDKIRIFHFCTTIFRQFMKEVSEVLREYQYHNNLTQHDMAQLLGIAQSTYNNWVNGQSAINPVKYYEKIAKICGVDISILSPMSQKLEGKDSHDLKSDAKGLVFCEKYVRSLEEMNEFLRKENERINLLLNEKSVS